MAWNVGEKKVETRKGTSDKTVPLQPSRGGASGGTASEEKASVGVGGKGKGRDLVGGMEILELDFLLGVIENTGSNDKSDVTMRKLGFGELIRREKLGDIDSSALKVYVKDESSLYGRAIQCEAMKELTIRTSRKGKRAD